MNVRAEPSTDAPVVRKLSAGDSVSIETEEAANNWAKIGEGEYVFMDVLSSESPKDRSSRQQYEAQLVCERAVEKSAKYSFEWTDGLLEPKFSRFGTNDKGQVAVQGDKIKMQNGFGAWQNQTYTCWYDPDTHALVSVDIQAGIL
ncbi:MAG: SH3 domain-containing protein [Pseudomonadales bacterium]